MEVRQETIQPGQLDMKLRNSTAWPDYMLRRMVSWCCVQLDMPVRSVRLAMFRNSKSTWGGCARGWRGQITVCVTRNESAFPAGCGTHEPGEKFADRMECLLAVTAHELYHVAAYAVPDHRQRTRGYGKGVGSSERVTCAQEMRVLRIFRQQRETLMASWMAAPCNQDSKPALSIKERNHSKAVKDLARWTRKLKLAQGKVSRLKIKVSNYERFHTCVKEGVSLKSSGTTLPVS